MVLWPIRARVLFELFYKSGVVNIFANMQIDYFYFTSTFTFTSGVVNTFANMQIVSALFVQCPRQKTGLIYST